MVACQWESPGLGQLWVLGDLLRVAGGPVCFLASRPGTEDLGMMFEPCFGGQSRFRSSAWKLDGNHL